MTNLELARAFFAGAPDDLVAAIEDPAWVETARAWLTGLFTEDFEFVTVSQSVGMPATRRGVDGFFDAYRAYAEMWESYSLRPERFVEVGDKVVVEAKIAGTTRTGGAWSCSRRSPRSTRSRPAAAAASRSSATCRRHTRPRASPRLGRASPGSHDHACS